MATVPLSNVDTAWLRMEAPTNPMMITSVMAFETPIEYDRLRATIEHRLLRFDRFRERVVQSRVPLIGPRWHPVPYLDLAYHLQQIDLPAPGDHAALEDLVSRLMSTQLDFSRPLWQFHLVQHYGDGCAIVARLHHCIADGIALIQVLFSLTDREPDTPWPEAEPAGRPESAGRRLLDPVTRPIRSAYRKTAQTTGLLWHEGLDTLIHPSHAVDLARLAAGSATALGRLALRWPDPKTLFKGPLCVPKRAAWSEPVALHEVKEIGKALGGTVNDVLLTAVSGALRGYLLEHGARADGLSIRGVIPVNLRKPGRELELGNKFGLIFLSLPIGVADPLERLRQLKCCMDGIKRTPEAAVAFGILNAIGMTASQIEDLVVTIFGTKGTAVMTNVPGPREKLYLAGAPLSTVMGWVPQSGHLGLGVSIISYAGQVRLGIATDQGLVPDPDRIITLFRQEFEELLALARSQAAARGVRPLLSTLDRALATLDEVQAQRAAPVEVQAQAAPRESERAEVAGPLPEAAGEDFARLWPASRPIALEAAPAAPNGGPAEAEMAPAGIRTMPAACGALTRSGQPCKNIALPGSSFCRVHRPRNALTGAPLAALLAPQPGPAGADAGAPVSAT